MTSMNHLVFLDTRAGELEKILSGVKRIVVKDVDPAQPGAPAVAPGDSLYFLRDNGECDLRVQATVVGVLRLGMETDQDLTRALKELQPKLQLDETQFSHWSTRGQALLVEFESAHKIEVIHVAAATVADRSDWIAFDDISRMVEPAG
jgi:hypothetical protein